MDPAQGQSKHREGLGVGLLSDNQALPGPSTPRLGLRTCLRPDLYAHKTLNGPGSQTVWFCPARLRILVVMELALHAKGRGFDPHRSHLLGGKKKEKKTDRAWSVKLNLSRPALRRTTERGMSTRAAATQRTTSSAPGGAMPSSGVPATATCMRPLPSEPRRP